MAFSCWIAQLSTSSGPPPAALVPPARAYEYLEGGSYSILIEHPSGSVLVQGSAGYIGATLAPLDVDVVFLGIGALGTKDDVYVDGYWKALVVATDAERVIPIHYEDFFLPISVNQKPIPALSDDLERTFAMLARRTNDDPNVALALMPYLQEVVLLRARL